MHTCLLQLCGVRTHCCAEVKPSKGGSICSSTGLCRERAWARGPLRCAQLVAHRRGCGSTARASYGGASWGCLHWLCMQPSARAQCMHSDCYGGEALPQERIYASSSSSSLCEPSFSSGSGAGGFSCSSSRGDSSRGCCSCCSSRPIFGEISVAVQPS